MTDVARAAPPAGWRPAGWRDFLTLRLDRTAIQPWVYLAPTLLVLGAFTYWPLAKSLWLSFFEWNLLPTSPKTFVGVENYERLLRLPEMQRALWNTVLYVVGLLPLSVGLPLVIVLTTQKLGRPAMAVYNALIFVPMIVAPVVAAIIWRWLFNADHGLINAGLASLGLGPIGFLQDPRFALASIVWITGWKLIGFSTLLLSAANNGINPAYLEAARVDGATEGQITRRIRLPLMSPTILLLCLMTVLLGAQWSFVYISVLTHGGPLKSTTNIYYLLWDYGFGNLSVGWSSAAGMIAFAGFSVLAFVGLRLTRNRAIFDA